MSKVRAVLFCIIGLMLAGLGMGLLRFHHLKEEPDALAVLPEYSDITLNHVHHVATRNGIKEWVLDAESVRYQKDENKTILKDISVTFFLNNGKTVHLVSSDGAFFTDTKDMEVSGDVVVRSGPSELKTEKLCYDYESRSISTDSRIVIKGEGIHLTGKGMTFSFKTEQAVVRGGVEAVFENCTL